MIVTLVVATTACDDDLNSVGNNIRPESDEIALGWDTISNITAETYSFQDRIYARTVKSVFGDYTDNILGRVKADFLSEFFCPEDMAFHKDLFAIDSVQVSLYVTRYSGDSLAPMGITAYEVDKKYLEDDYYTNIDPKDFTTMSKIFAQGVFSMKNTPNINGYRVISADADTMRGWDFFNKWKTNPEFFKDSKTFRENILKGLYITPTYGSGALADVGYTMLDVFYRYNAGKKVNENTDSIGYGLFRLNTTLEVVQMNHVENKIDVSNTTGLNKYTDRTFMKTPAGVCTKLNIPLGSIIDLMKDKKNLNAATFKLMGFSEEEANLRLNKPSSILLIHKDSLDGFFSGSGKNYLTSSNNSISVISRGTSNNTYDFSNIANVISYYIKEYQQRGINPNNVPLELLMLPVSLESTLTSSGSVSSTRIYHLMSPTEAILRTGTGKMKMPLIFSKYSSQSNK